MANIYSVTQVNQYIKNMFQTDFLLNSIRVSGEISNCKYHPSGHIYFTLKDKDGAIAAVMFAGNRHNLKFQLKDGMLVVASGSVSIYERDGKYQLYVKSVEQAGNGVRYEQFLALKKQLEEMGMFDPVYKKTIPPVVKTLGVVTASSGAAFQDIINVSTRRNPYIQIVLYPALVQGEGAVKSICKGINALDKYGVDVIIVGRGGGSIEDLWAFNEEEVAHSIFNCETPIISAVGHETDFTIADFVSDLRAPTPSAAAELAVCDMAQIIFTIEEYKRRMYKAVCDKINDLRNRVEGYNLRIKYLSPQNVLNEHYRKLSDISDAMDRVMDDRINSSRNRLQLLCSRMEALSPLAKLSSGYSFVSDESGGALTSVREVQNNQQIFIHMSDGKVSTRVDGIEFIDREGSYED